MTKLADESLSIDWFAQWLSGRPWESLKQKLKHQPRLGAKVVTIFKLPKVLLQVLRGNPNVSPVDAALEHTPRSLRWCWYGPHRARILSWNGQPFMLIAVNIQVPISLALVGVDTAAFDDPFSMTGTTSSTRRLRTWRIRTSPRRSTIPRMMCLSSSPALSRPPMKALSTSTIGSPLPPRGTVAVNPSHVLANFVTNSPCGFVSHPRLTLNFLSTQAVAGGAKQKHNIKPRPQRRTGTLERRSGHRVYVVPTIAGIGRKLLELVKRVYLATVRANGFLAVSGLEKCAKQASSSG